MEYYAKSKKRQLSQGEKDKLKEDLDKIKEKLQDELDETEINIINHTIDDLDKDAEEKQIVIYDVNNTGCAWDCSRSRL